MVRDNLASGILHQQDVNVNKCYQCGKCSAGCPVSIEMDYPPSVVMRMIQTGNQELAKKVEKSYSIWVCLSCETCYCRCPMDIDIPKVMDHMRHMSLLSGNVNKKAKKIIAFHQSFLNSIKNHGRLYEMGMLVNYKMKTWDLFQDVLLAPVLFFKGKLHILPGKIKDRRGLRNIFIKTSKR